jgi:methylmalonyl-CoA/ethylmalonyl-CoA epimerase
VLKKIHHVAVVVKSADESLKFYRDALGLPVTKDEVIEDQGVRGVLLQAGAGEIELIEPVREGTGVARFLETKGEGLHHICFESDDVAAELAASAAKGLALIDQAPRKGLAGMIGFLHPKATRGVLIEYATPIPGEDTHAAHGDGPVKNLDHVAVVVSDLDAGVQTWQQNYNLPLERTGEALALGIRQAILPIGTAFVEVITPLGEEGAVATFLKDKGEGLFLVSLEVDGLDGAVSRLREKGVRVGDPSGGTGGARLAFVSPRNTSGVTVQLIERGGA